MLQTCKHDIPYSKESAHPATIDAASDESISSEESSVEYARIQDRMGTILGHIQCHWLFRYSESMIPILEQAQSMERLDTEVNGSEGNHTPVVNGIGMPVEVSLHA